VGLGFRVFTRKKRKIKIKIILISKQQLAWISQLVLLNLMMMIMDLMMMNDG
jgi:hypothetical protein